MSKFVISGARGYVARRLIRRLIADGHEVVGLTRGGCTKSGEPGCREVAVGDYTDEALLARTVNAAEAVFHLAAQAHNRSTSKDEGAIFHAANVLPTAALARACARVNVARFVMVSTIGVLGNSTKSVAFSDATQTAPVDAYAVSKSLAEELVTEVLSENDCDYCILRPPLVYGPGSPGNFAGLVAIAAKAPLIPLAGIHAPRTFIYVDHLVNALVVAATHPAASRRKFVISDGEDTSVAEIICCAAKTFGRHPWRVVAIPELLLRTFGILAGQRARIDKLLAPLRVDAIGFQSATGWHPDQHTSEAIASTIREWQVTTEV
jgi:UDP-glucose 4-epimerase